jgi:hypothetical protein
MTKTQRLGALGIAAVIAVAAVILISRDRGEPQRDQQGAPGAPATAGSPPDARRPEPTYTQLHLRDGKPVGGVKRISVEAGDLLRLEARSNTSVELHIHGYDRYVRLQPDKPRRLRFRADLEGIFEIEDHHTQAQIAELRVTP